MANAGQLASAAREAGDEILRLAPTRSPRSFLQPGRRRKSRPNDYNVSGMNRGGIDKCWFGSTTVVANEGAPEVEGFSDVVTHFKDNNYLEPTVCREGDGWVDKWIVYGKVDDKQLFTAKELTLQPGAKCTVTDGGAYRWITVQGHGTIGKLNLQTPQTIRFGAMTEDKVFVIAKTAAAGVTFENTGTEPVIGLRYLGPNAQPNAPALGDFKR